MEKFIILQENQINSFKGKAKRNGQELDWKAIEPVSIKSPANHSILPATLLNDPDIVEAFPQLSSLLQLDKSEIVFWEYDEEGNRI